MMKATNEHADAPLNEMDKNEWRDICRSIKPDITEEQFERDWNEFIALKRSKTIN